MIPFLEFIQGLRAKNPDRGDYRDTLLHKESKVSDFGAVDRWWAIIHRVRPGRAPQGFISEASHDEEPPQVICQDSLSSRGMCHDKWPCRPITRYGQLRAAINAYVTRYCNELEIS